MQHQISLHSPLLNIDSNKPAEWNSRTRRVGLIARKIGNYPLWSKDGKKMLTTLLQVQFLYILMNKALFEFLICLFKESRKKKIVFFID